MSVPVEIYTFNFHTFVPTFSIQSFNSESFSTTNRKFKVKGFKFIYITCFQTASIYYRSLELKN